ncbi:MAG: 30S ribosomal protein S7 [Candidatus Diapherotrites archaeon]
MKVFGKWDTKEVKIHDISLANHLSLETKAIPHTFGTGTRKRFKKSEVSIVERLINKLMRSGQGKRKLSGKYMRGRGGCGKKFQTMQMVEEAFDKINAQTKQNPIQVLIDAIEKAGPREDVTRIKKGGLSFTQSVDVAPIKRIDESLKNLALATFAASYKTKKTAAAALADELIKTAKEDSTSMAIKRRDEVERIAKSSR